MRSKSYVSHYKVTVREPGWERATMFWEEFGSVVEAEKYLRDMAPTFPEGTIFWITNIWSDTPAWAPRGLTTRKSFVVNEYGEAVKRKGKWVPEGMVAKEWLKSPPEIVIPPEPVEPEIVKGLDDTQRDRLLDILIELNPEEASKARIYKLRRKEYEIGLRRLEDYPRRDWFRPSELGGVQETLGKILGEGK